MQYSATESSTTGGQLAAEKQDQASLYLDTGIFPGQMLGCGNPLFDGWNLEFQEGMNLDHLLSVKRDYPGVYHCHTGIRKMVNTGLAVVHR